jgi:hypothetical protein
MRAEEKHQDFIVFPTQSENRRHGSKSVYRTYLKKNQTELLEIKK